jgi:hypothetical protein
LILLLDLLKVAWTPVSVYNLETLSEYLTYDSSDPNKATLDLSLRESIYNT